MPGSVADPDRVRQAVELVAAGWSYGRAARQTGLTKALVARHSKGGYGDTWNMGTPTVLTRKEESTVVDNCIHLTSHGFPVTRHTLRARVSDVCSDGRPVPWNPEKGPGRKWLEGFFQRHRAKITERRCHIYESSRVEANDAITIDAHFTHVKAAYDLHKPDAAHILNLDETGMWQHSATCGNAVRYK